MHVIVLGAGVVGVTSAWYLAKAGHQVTVIERSPAPGQGTSYGNAGQISPALSAPWAFPGLVRKAIGFALAKYPPLRLGRMPDREMATFLWRMWRASGAPQYIDSKRHMVRIAEYSRDCFVELRDEIGIEYAGRQRGLMVTFRDPAQLAGYDTDLGVLDELGVPYRRLGQADIMALEPNLSPQSGIIGGVLLETDETGDCYRFTQALAAEAAAIGVRFRYGEAVESLVVAGEKVRGVRTAGGETASDAVVVALGVASRGLLAPLGIRLPIYPVKGYSLTIDADSDAVGPHSTVGDETYKIGITNLGDRIRVGGTAELAGYDLSRPEARYAGMIHAVKQLFPNIPEAAIAGAERWSGLRPVTPDGPPLIGRTRIANLYLNSGHGTLGWTMSCGSGRVLADLVSGLKPAVALSRFNPIAA